MSSAASNAASVCSVAHGPRPSVAARNEVEKSAAASQTRRPAACARATSRSNVRQVRRHQPRRARRPCRATRLRARARLDDQCPRGDHGGQFRVAELLQQPEHVAVDRLLPDVLPRVEVAAHADRVDPRVQRTGVQGQQARLRPSRSRRSSRPRRPLPVANQSTPARTFCTS